MESNSQQFDVIIVGGGVMGSSAAYQASKRGLKTVLLEQFDFLHHRGSSHGESRSIRLTYPHIYYYPLVLESYKLWQEIQAQVGYKVYFKAHHFDMGPSNDPCMKAIIHYCNNLSIPHQLLRRHEVATKFSGRFDIPEDWIGISNEYGGVIKPTKAVAMFQTLANQNGALLIDNTEVINIKRNDTSVVVSTARGETFRGKKCIITVGAWASKLIKTVSGIELPIQPLETHACYWRIKEGQEGKFELGNGDNLPTFASFGKLRVYGTPSLEFPGLIKAAAHEGNPCDPDKRTWGPATLMEELKEWVKKRFSGVVDSSEPVVKQACMYSMTPDEDFVIDFLGGEFRNDVVIGAGFSGHGFKMAPVIGRILTELAVDGETKGIDVKPFTIGRFKITS